MSERSNLPTDGFVTAAWVKTRYGISNSTLYAWIKSSRLPRPYRIGLRAVRFRVEELRAFEERFIADRKVR